MGTPKAEINSKILEFFYASWSRDWKSYNKANMSKFFYKSPDINQAKYVLKLGRIEMSRFVKIITGHNGLFYFKNKIDKEINPQCRFCLEDVETFTHLLTDCPRFINKRREIFLDLDLKTNEKWSVRDLLSFSTSDGIREALDGDTSIGMFGDGWLEDGRNMIGLENRSADGMENPDGEDHNWFSERDDSEMED